MDEGRQHWLRCQKIRLKNISREGNQVRLKEREIKTKIPQDREELILREGKISDLRTRRLQWQQECSTLTSTLTSSIAPLLPTVSVEI